MNTADALEALSRERPLTEAEVDRLYRQQFPSQTAEGKRAWYAKHKARVCQRNRERYASDPEWRAHRLAGCKAAYQRRKAKRCSA